MVRRFTPIGVTKRNFNVAAQAQGDVPYFDGTIWTRLGAGTSGKVLKTQGAGANPAWSTSTLIDNAELLVELLKGGRFLHVPTNGGWTGFVTGNGVAGVQNPLYQQLETGVGASSSGLYAEARGLGSVAAGTVNKINFSKKLYWGFNVSRTASITLAVGRLILHQGGGVLSKLGFGLLINNMSLFGTSFGTSGEDVDLGVTLTTLLPVDILIVHTPSVPQIEWFVNGVSKGTQSTSAKVPQTETVEGRLLLCSIENGAAEATAFMLVGNHWLWQSLT